MSDGRLRIAAALLLTSPFTPMLFQGEEWGTTTPFQYFTDHDDPDLGRAVSEGRRNEFSYFGWDPADVPDPQDRSTFERSKLEWSQLDDDVHRSMLDWYRQLIALRRRHACLSDPRLNRVDVEVDAESRTLIVRRGEIDVLVNLGSGDQRFPSPGRLLAASDPAVVVSDGEITVPVDAVALVHR